MELWSWRDGWGKGEIFPYKEECRGKSLGGCGGVGDFGLVIMLFMLNLWTDKGGFLISTLTHHFASSTSKSLFFHHPDFHPQFHTISC